MTRPAPDPPPPHRRQRPQAAAAGGRAKAQRCDARCAEATALTPRRPAPLPYRVCPPPPPPGPPPDRAEWARWSAFRGHTTLTRPRPQPVESAGGTVERSMVKV